VRCEHRARPCEECHRPPPNGEEVNLKIRRHWQLARGPGLRFPLAGDVALATAAGRGRPGPTGIVRQWHWQFNATLPVARPARQACPGGCLSAAAARSVGRCFNLNAQRGYPRLVRVRCRVQSRASGARQRPGTLIRASGHHDGRLGPQAPRVVDSLPGSLSLPGLCRLVSRSHCRTRTGPVTVPPCAKAEPAGPGLQDPPFRLLPVWSRCVHRCH
jgi:hypothetical protein